MKVWCAIGDSFTYLNDHLDETGYRLHKGYITRTVEKLTPLLGEISVINHGINGAITQDFLNMRFEPADFYTILLGTNDWFRAIYPAGSQSDFDQERQGTIVGNLATIIRHIREVSPCPIFVLNPVERSEFIYILDHGHVDHGSYEAAGGQELKDVARAIYTCVHGDKVYPVDLHGLSGFTPENAVHFQRKRVGGKETDLPYPRYLNVPYDPGKDDYPYPEEAANMTYDGLHPSDKGSDILAGILAKAIASKEIKKSVRKENKL